MSNDRFIDRARPRAAFTARVATITLTTPLSCHQICQVAFGKDGSVYFTFPYFDGPTDGLISTLAFPDNPTGTVALDLKPGGRVTAHQVKASHHRNGRAHFSLTPKVKGVVGRQSFALDTRSGLAFQLQCYRLDRFRVLPTGAEKPSRLYLHFRAPDEVPTGLMITGEWRRMEELPPSLVIEGMTVPFVRLNPGGSVPATTAMVLAPPPGFPLHDRCLILQSAPLAAIPGLPDAAMIYMGGFDYADVPTGAPARPGTGCITFLYPIPDRQALGGVIGSADADANGGGDAA